MQVDPIKAYARANELTRTAILAEREGRAVWPAMLRRDARTLRRLARETLTARAA